MRLEANEKGKFILLDKDGRKVEFDYGVDAGEALLLEDEDGEKRYTLPGEKSKPAKKKDIPPEDFNDDEEDVPQVPEAKETKVKEREVKTIGTKREVKTIGTKKKAAKKKAAKKKA